MNDLYNDERLIEQSNIDSHIENEHKHRYKTAALLVKGKRVLDAACGSGYGSNILAKEAKSVVGIDYSKATIDYCMKKYQRDNLSYRQMSVEKLDFPEESFDVVVSFETLEHLPETIQQVFMEEIKRVLTKDGVLIMSSPNRDVWSRMINKEENEHHLHELDEKEFRALLTKTFANVDFYYQNYIPVSFIGSPNKESKMRTLFSDNFSGYDMSAYSIAICSNQDIDFDFSGLYIPQLMQGYNEGMFGFVDVSLYCDCGEGFCEADKLHAPLNVMPDGRLSVEFQLKQDASALRFDPGEFPCAISQFEVSDETLEIVPENGIKQDEDRFLFYDYDPILLIKGRDNFTKGEKLTFIFSYNKPDCVEIGKQLNSLAEEYLALEKKQYLDELAYERQLDEKYSKCIYDKDVHIRNIECENLFYQQAIQEIQQSFSWKVTAPLRRILSIIHRRR